MLIQTIGVQTVTTDKYQGRETMIVIFCLTSGSQTAKTPDSQYGGLPAPGAGFFKDPKRLNVGSTRQTEFLFVVGDLGSVPTQQLAQYHLVEERDEDELGAYSAATLRRYLDWFVQKSRVIYCQ
jgi:superfamily I DNA and/or RNA helicase